MMIEGKLGAPSEFAIFGAVKRIILAFGSPQRTELLREARYDFIARTASVTELAVDFLTPGELTLLNACRKAFAVARTEPDTVVLGADTLVAFQAAMCC